MCTGKMLVVSKDFHILNPKQLMFEIRPFLPIVTLLTSVHNVVSARGARYGRSASFSDLDAFYNARIWRVLVQQKNGRINCFCWIAQTNIFIILPSDK